jgi:hypothetical protein
LRTLSPHFFQRLFMFEQNRNLWVSNKKSEWIFSVIEADAGKCFLCKNDLKNYREIYPIVGKKQKRTFVISII